MTSHDRPPFWLFGVGSLSAALVALVLVSVALYGTITHPLSSRCPQSNTTQVPFQPTSEDAYDR